MRRRDKKPKIPPSEDDLWLAELHGRMAKAAAKWLKATVNIDRPIKSLTLAELKSMCGAVEAEWLKSVAERISNDPTLWDETEKDTYALLLGV